MTPRLALCALLLASPAAAQAPLERVLSAVSLPLSEEGHDVAVLVDDLEDGADLYLYVGLDSAKLRAGAKPALLKKNVAWNGGMAGSRPSLEASPKGSLLIKSGNEAVGRGRWSETLTIVYRNGVALVAGVTREERDTLDPAAGGVCDINLLTGKGTRSGRKLELRPRSLPLADWSEDQLPKECQF